MKYYLKVLLLLNFINPINAETLTFKSGELAAVSISGENGSGTLIKSNSQIKKITNEIKDEIAKAFDYAEKSEFPKFNSVKIDEYAN